MGKLRDRQIQTLPRGRHADGGNLYLEVGASGRRTWLLRYQLSGKRHDMGLGSYPAVSLKEARTTASEAMNAVSRGINPIAARRAAKGRSDAIPTFAEISKLVIAEAQNRSTNSKVRYQWEQQLGPSYCGLISNLPVHEITSTHVAELLKPIGKTKPEVARKLESKLREVFDFARVVVRDRHGIELGQNPANSRDLRALGHPRPRHSSRGRYPSLHYQETPEFMKALQPLGLVSSLGLQLLVLTTMRTNTILGAKWHEFRLNNVNDALWVIPKGNLKDHKYRTEDFRHPLSRQAVQILEQLKELRCSDFVLPGGGKSQQPSNGIFLALMRRLNNPQLMWLDKAQNKPATPHGFRSSYRTWAEEQTNFTFEVKETAFAHQVGNQVQRAYQRSDLLDQRREILQDWADFIMPMG